MAEESEEVFLVSLVCLLGFFVSLFLNENGILFAFYFIFYLLYFSSFLIFISFFVP